MRKLSQALNGFQLSSPRMPLRRLRRLRGPRCNDAAVDAAGLQSRTRTVRVRQSGRWRAPCSVWQPNAYVLNLSKLTLQQ